MKCCETNGAEINEKAQKVQKIEKEEETRTEELYGFKELPEVLKGEYAEKLSVYIDNDKNRALVPPGWAVSGSEEEDKIVKGLVLYCIPESKVKGINWNKKRKVERLRKKYDQIIWVPVNSLLPNGTLDGVHYCEKFGRRNFMKEMLLKYELDGELLKEVQLQIESVKNKYGGFYFSRYNISKNRINGKPRSIKGRKPWTKITDREACKVIKKFEKSEKVQSHIMYNIEYDTILEWFKESKARTKREIAENSTNWGNYIEAEDSPGKITKTGSNENWCTNNAFDFAGNVKEWTQQEKNDTRTLRGGSFYEVVKSKPVANCEYIWALGDNSENGFRAALYIE